MRRTLSLVVLALAGLTGCSVLDSMNPFKSRGPKVAELQAIQATAQARVVWRESIGKSEVYSFMPAIVDSTIYAAGRDGSLIRIDDGKQSWKVNVGQTLSGGVGADRDRVIVGSSSGQVLAFSASEGKLLWKAEATSEILSPPALGGGMVVVRSADNRLIAYDAFDGTRRWIFQRPMPALSVRMTAQPLIDHQFIFAGFPGGKLIAVNLENGAAVWDGTVAQPKGATELERASDITSAPVIFQRTICAVAYQGRVSCFDLMRGNLIWARAMSSTSGLSIDGTSLYVTDDRSAVHALDLETGASLWKQDKLALRRLTAPLPFRRYVIVADLQGVLHFLDKENGSFVARVTTDGSPVVAPLQLFGRQILVQTANGGIFAVEQE
ncbi:MAG: outer membrane protein assembly factor BamB [Candidatus Accumulibacter sp.]|jgi:outer membrane protein assembly factor BamB|nr:outer membrane protein assembly factor BamB [Accumulibacter sp.]